MKFDTKPILKGLVYQSINEMFMNVSLYSHFHYFECYLSILNAKLIKVLAQSRNAQFDFHYSQLVLRFQDSPQVLLFLRKAILFVQYSGTKIRASYHKICWLSFIFSLFKSGYLNSHTRNDHLTTSLASNTLHAFSAVNWLKWGGGRVLLVDNKLILKLKII